MGDESKIFSRSKMKISKLINFVVFTKAQRFIGESDMGFIGFEDSELTKTEESLSDIDQVIIKLTDDFLPMVNSARPSNSRWTRLVNRFSARKLRGGKCFKSDGTSNSNLMALVSSASNFNDFVSLFHSLIDSTMKNCKSNDSWHNRLNS